MHSKEGAFALLMQGERDLPLWQWRTVPGYHGDGKEEVSGTTTKKTSGFIEFYDFSWPHLKLLPELQVGVVHLRDRDIVILSLLLVQQLVPDRDNNIDGGDLIYISFTLHWTHHPRISPVDHPLSDRTQHLCTTSIMILLRRVCAGLLSSSRAN